MQRVFGLGRQITSAEGTKRVCVDWTCLGAKSGILHKKMLASKSTLCRMAARHNREKEIESHTCDSLPHFCRAQSDERSR
jgi:hypothetical protein